MPEGIRRATLNQEMVRRMVNTSEMVPLADRLEVVNDYVQKLVNSEYSVNETRDIIIGGLKGYERLLSLSKDTRNPRWKPLHMAGKSNSKNRRLAKLRSKEVDPPEIETKQAEEERSRRMEGVQGGLVSW